MRNVNEMRIEKILDCLYLLGFTKEQVEKCESYFLGETGFPDLEVKEKWNAEEQQYKTSKHQARAQLEMLYKGKKYEDYGKLFRILFQMFGVSMKEFYETYDITYKISNEELIKHLPKAEFVAFYAEITGTTNYYIKAETYKSILTIAGNDNAVLERALELSDGVNCNGRLMIYTAYFMKNGKVESGTLLDGIKGLFGKGDTDNYKKMFENYVRIIINNIKNLFDCKITENEEKQLLNYVNGDAKAQRNKAVCDILDKYDMNEFIQTLLVSCVSMNYKLSPKLSNFLKLCAYGKHFNKTLDYIKRAATVVNVGDLAADLKKDLQLDPADFICWCGTVGLKKTLSKEAAENSQAYIEAIEKAEDHTYKNLVDVVKSLDADTYNKYYKNVFANGNETQQKKIAEDFAGHEANGADGQLKVKLYSYLLGEGRIEEVYPYQADFTSNRYYYAYQLSLDNYKSVYGTDAFYKRCKVFMALKENYSVLLDGFGYKTKDNVQYILDLFEEFREAGLSITKQFEAAAGMYHHVWNNEKLLLEAFVTVFTSYMEQSETEILSAVKSSDAEGRFIGVHILANAGDRYADQLFEYFGDSANLVKNALIDIILQHNDWTDRVLEKLNSKKAAERELAVRIISKLEGNYSAKLSEALEKEKSKKVIDLIKSILNVEAGESTQSTLTTDSYVKEIHRGNRRRGLAWAYETEFLPVHFLNGEEIANLDYMQAVLLSYSTMNLPGYNKEVFLLTNQLDKGELALYVNELFDKWLEKGGEAKQKWVLYAAAIHGGASIVDKMKHQIDEWAKNSRGSIAADAVKALALNDSPTALLIVDSIARKYKFKQVKAAAGKALELAAEQLGLSTEELADRIVPDLGFNEQMERIFDYGERTFKVYITPTLEIEIYDENDKKLKNMPAPGKKDDEVKAAQSYAEFKQMKKQMKTTVSNQKLRLELALSANRKWKVDKWQELFVKNPIMHQFAISLIWGIYENGELKETFRYMEDGSFNTVDEDEYELQENGEIGLVHPIELDEDTRKQWEEQLEDYEIIQSIEQLKRPVYHMTEEERNGKLLERFGGMILNDLSLSGKLQTMGWYKGPALDAGMYELYYREDKECNMAVELHFSGSYIGGENEDVTVYGAYFYAPGSVKRESYSYDHVKEKDACNLSDVPARYFSEIVYQLTKATSSSQEVDESWREGFSGSLQ